MSRFTSFIKKHNLLFKGINFFLVLLSWTWVVQTSQLSPTIKFDIEPILTFITTILSLGYLEIDGRTNKLEADRSLAKLFIQELPSGSDTISFLSESHMGDSFELKHLSILLQFVDDWSIPEREFHNTDLEQKKRELLNLLGSIVDIASHNTWDVGNNRQRVPSEWMYNQPERWEHVVGELSSLSHMITEQHRELIRSLRSILEL